MIFKAKPIVSDLALRDVALQGQVLRAGGPEDQVFDFE